MNVRHSTAFTYFNVPRSAAVKGEVVRRRRGYLKTIKEAHKGLRSERALVGDTVSPEQKREDKNIPGLETRQGEWI